jgi:integrase
MNEQEGFDRGVNFKDIKEILIKAYEDTLDEFNNFDPDDRYYTSKKKKKTHRLVYLLITLIQLYNGSRISEACKAFRQMIKDKNFDDKVKVKISKSESIKYDKDGEEFITKARFRYMIFPPNWILKEKIPQNHLYCDMKFIEDNRMKKRILSYLLHHHNINTHSLRYALINHMLYEKKVEPTLVAKHVGHSNTAQLLRYTQRIEADKLFEMEL